MILHAHDDLAIAEGTCAFLHIDSKQLSALATSYLAHFATDGAGVALYSVSSTPRRQPVLLYEYKPIAHGTLNCVACKDLVELLLQVYTCKDVVELLLQVFYCFRHYKMRECLLCLMDLYSWHYFKAKADACYNEERLLCRWEQCSRFCTTSTRTALRVGKVTRSPHTNAGTHRDALFIHCWSKFPYNQHLKYVLSTYTCMTMSCFRDMSHTRRAYVHSSAQPLVCFLKVVHCIESA